MLPWLQQLAKEVVEWKNLVRVAVFWPFKIQVLLTACFYLCHIFR